MIPRWEALGNLLFPPLPYIPWEENSSFEINHATLFSGMVLVHYIGQMTTIHMHINLSGGNTFMAQHLLYGSKVRSVFQKVGGKGMSERMWTNTFL